MESTSWGNVAKFNFHFLFGWQRGAVSLLVRFKKLSCFELICNKCGFPKLICILTFKIFISSHHGFFYHKSFIQTHRLSTQSHDTRAFSNILLTNVQFRVTIRFRLHKGVNLCNKMFNELKCIREPNKLMRNQHQTQFVIHTFLYFLLCCFDHIFR